MICVAYDTGVKPIRRSSACDSWRKLTIRCAKALGLLSDCR